MNAIKGLPARWRIWLRGPVFMDCLSPDVVFDLQGFSDAFQFQPYRILLEQPQPEAGREFQALDHRCDDACSLIHSVGPLNSSGMVLF